MSDSRWYNSDEFNNLVDKDQESSEHISARGYEDYMDNDIKRKYIKREEF